MPDNILIRKAILEDARGIAVVQIEGWRWAYKDILDSNYLNNLKIEQRPTVWEKNLLHPGATTWVAVSQDQIVGFCGAGPLRTSDSIAHLDHTMTGEIYAIYVLPAFHRQGLGRRFFLKSRKYFEETGKIQFVLWVLKENKPAQLFYASQGGILIAEELRPLADNNYLEVCLLFE